MTEKIVTISTEHSTHHTKETQAIHLEMHGGSPWYSYLWIDDVCYTIRKKARSVEVVRTK